MYIERSIDKATAELMSASNADEMDGASGYYPEKQTKLCSAVPMSEYDSDVIDEERAAFGKRLKLPRRTMAKSR